MLVVIGLGGHALLSRGEEFDLAAQRDRAAIAARAIAEIAREHDVIVTHGNGPQVGALAVQSEPARGGGATSLDVLDAESVGMIGYLLEQELGNELDGRDVAALITQVVVDEADPAFADPTKPIGPKYTEDQAKALVFERGWSIAPEGDGWRRVVPSPRPRAIVDLRTIEILLEFGVVVICTGGGGIPVCIGADGGLHGVEAVIDKDRSAALLAEDLSADALVLLTDVDAVMADWGMPTERPIRVADPAEFEAIAFAPGSMGPKVAAACEFARTTGRPAMIGSIEDAAAVLRGDAGTTICMTGESAPSPDPPQPPRSTPRIMHLSG
ncbi:MAG: carbamate kinase [Acidimicrobiia bacterium]|nr:carbamate kinase [Acidimicrobiia bacterium]